MPRQRKAIDVEQVKKLAEKQWQTAEIAAFFGIHPTNLNKRFAAEIAVARQSGKAKLRDLQWKRAMEGSDRVLLHMSKHYLGQHDKIEQETNLKTNFTVINRPNGAQTILKSEILEIENELMEGEQNGEE